MAAGAERAPTANAIDPRHFGWRDWWAVTKRVFNAVGEDNLFLISAGVAFYAMLAIFPMLAALVAVYGYAADPAAIESHLDDVAELAPPGAYEIIAGQVNSITEAGRTTLGYTSLIGTLITLWTARLGVGAMIDGLNHVYRERQGRGILASLAVAYGMTAVLILVAAVALGTVVILPGILAFLDMGGSTGWIVALIRWPVALAATLVGIGLLYKYGPARARPRYSWISVGSVLALLLWLAGSSLFSWYVANFASYNETYGSLGAVIGLMMWFYYSAFIVLLGAEVNAQMEFHTVCDSTEGRPKPMGERGAFVADNMPNGGPPPEHVAPKDGPAPKRGGLPEDAAALPETGEERGDAVPRHGQRPAGA